MKGTLVQYQHFVHTAIQFIGTKKRPQEKVGCEQDILKKVRLSI